MCLLVKLLCLWLFWVVLRLVILCLFMCLLVCVGLVVVFVVGCFDFLVCMGYCEVVGLIVWLGLGLFV